MLTEKDIRDLEFYAKTHTVGIFDLKVSVSKDILLELCGLARKNLQSEPSIIEHSTVEQTGNLKEKDVVPVLTKSKISVSKMILEVLRQSSVPNTDREIEQWISQAYPNEHLTSSSVRTRRNEILKQGLISPGPKVERNGRLVRTWMIKK